MNERPITIIGMLRFLLALLLFQVWGIHFALGQTHYTVLPGDTFSRIARAHDLSLSELRDANPDKGPDLSPGDRIRIPEAMVLATLPNVRSSQGLHTVEAGETLYAIGQRYGLTVGQLEELNPFASGGLNVGDVLQVSLKSAGAQALKPVDLSTLGVPDSLQFDPQARLPVLRKDTLRTLVMLPFMLDADTVKGGGFDAKTSRLREISLEFLHGVQWAAAMLNDSGYSVAVRVVDTEPDAHGARAWTDADLMWSDVVLGPLRKEQLDSVNGMLAHSEIPQWVLTPQHEEVWSKHPWAFTLEAQPEIGMHALGAFAAERHAGETVLLIETKGKDASMEAAFRAGFLEAATPGTVLKPVPANAQFCKGLLAELDASKVNAIALPSGVPAQSLTAYIQTELQLADAFQVQLYGHPASRDFDFLERRFLERSHWTVPVSCGTRWEDATSVHQIETYRTMFQTEPSLYALVACDAMLESARWQGLPWSVPESVYYHPLWLWDAALNRWMNHQWNIEQYGEGRWTRVK